MKYQSTSRTLSLLFHTLIVLAFGALGAYFGFFVVPQYFSSYFADWTEYLFDASYFLYLELAVFGIAFFLISIYGAIQAYKSLANPNDDEPVVKSLTAFVVEGWILSIGLLLQGILLFDVVSNDNSSNMAFTVVVSIVFAIILLIATNIPMVKLYDGRDQNKLLESLLYGVSLFCIVMTLETVLSLVVILPESFSRKTDILYLLATIAGSNLLASILSFLSARKISKGSLSVTWYLSAGAAFALAAGLIIFGSLDMTYYDSAVHFNHVGAGQNSSASNVSNFGYGFPIMSIVIGAALLAAAGYLVWYGSNEHAKQVSHKA